ncbi:MAG: hypothetical protein RL637_1064 [Pseudomonadota bacterium]|jgi:hypothetical protein
MTTMSSKFAPESAGKKNDSGSLTAADEAGYDNVELGDYYSFPLENEKVSKKMAARRKVEMLWEKKRLRDQLGDFEETEDYDDDFNFLR